MNLPFSTVLNGKKTHFIEKIWTGLIDHEIVPSTEILPYVRQHTEKFGHDWDFVQGKSIPKIHTIRGLSYPVEINRFKKGDKIHFVINNRTKNRFQFAPVVPVVSNQVMRIHYGGRKYPTVQIFNIDKYGKLRENAVRYLDPSSHFYYMTELDVLAKNDGFENVDSFLEYFDMDGFFNIIHWTNFRY